MIRRILTSAAPRPPWAARPPLASLRPSPLRRDRARGDRRGVAMLFVIAAMMVLTVLVSDMRFGAQVRFLAATHGRDEAVARGLAMSGVNLYRLILMASKQMEGNSMLRTMLMGRTLADMMPVMNTALLRMMFATGGDVESEDAEYFQQTGTVSEDIKEEAAEETSRFGKKGFLDFDGEFSAEIQGEDCRLNLNMLSSHTTGQTVQELPAAQLLYRVMSTEENLEWLRERNLDPWDLIANLVDWVDADNVVASGKGGYEDDFYNRLSSPYLAKNAPFDTVEEIRLVEGWQDEVFERFEDSLTIYGSQKINVNCADDQMVRALLQASSTRLITDSDMDRIMEALNNYRLATFFQKSQDACNWFKGEVPDLDATGFCRNIVTTNKVYTITSTGLVGDTSVTAKAVISYDTTTGSKEGKFIYWQVQ